MIQDISPMKMDITYRNTKPKETDYMFCFWGTTALLKEDDAAGRPPTYASLLEHKIQGVIYYICKLEDASIFVFLSEKEMILPGYHYQSVQVFRESMESGLRFAGVTAYHLYQWYRDHKFCSRCGHPLQQDQTERMLFCEACGYNEYPKIAPAIIVGIVHQDKILLTKYANRGYKRYALVAGFAEIGESLEDTVRREVMEEVGLQVKNITYYKSQPWGFDSNLLVGYFAELSGDDTITLDTNELALAKWVSRDEMEVSCDNMSLTNEMMHVFFSGQLK